MIEITRERFTIRLTNTGSRVTDPMEAWQRCRRLLDGYAGGLGPDNVLAELERIREVAGNCRIWIDMETKIRSHSDRIFDLAKCRSVLEQMKPFVRLPVST